MSPNALWSAMNAWSRIATAYARMNLSAGEVIARRSTMMLTGAMSAPEATKMMLEKPATFATAAQRAMAAAARGGNAATVTEAALRPYKTKTAANARRLRK